MSADNVTPIAPAKPYTLEQAQAFVASKFPGTTVLITTLPCDLDAAGIALEKARAILDLLTTVIEEAGETDRVSLPGTFPNTLVQTLYAALGEVERADDALFGKTP